MSERYIATVEALFRYPMLGEMTLSPAGSASA